MASLLPAVGTGFPFPEVFQVEGPTGTTTYEGPIINGIPMPGQWLLTSAPKPFGWQEQQANFLSGAFLVPKGDPLVLIEYDVRIWEASAAANYRSLLGNLLKKPVTAIPGSTGSSAALGISDPSLKDIGITQVVVWSVTPLYNPLVGSGGKGCWTAKVQFKEYKPQKQAPPVPDQVIPDPGAVTPPAFATLQTANAAVAAGNDARQKALATSLLSGH